MEGGVNMEKADFLKPYKAGTAIYGDDLGAHHIHAFLRIFR